MYTNLFWLGPWNRSWFNQPEGLLVPAGNDNLQGVEEMQLWRSTWHPSKV